MFGEVEGDGEDEQVAEQAGEVAAGDFGADDDVVGVDPDAFVGALGGFGLAVDGESELGEVCVCVVDAGEGDEVELVGDDLALRDESADFAGLLAAG